MVVYVSPRYSLFASMAKIGNGFSLRHSSRSRQLKLSTSQFCIGFPTEPARRRHKADTRTFSDFAQRAPTVQYHIDK